MFQNELFDCLQGTSTPQSFATSLVIAAGTAVGHLQRAQVQPASKRASVKHAALTKILMHTLTHALSLDFNYFSPASLARDSEHLRYNESRVVFKDFNGFHNYSEFVWARSCVQPHVHSLRKNKGEASVLFVLVDCRVAVHRLCR